ncbi:hypothetical protein Pint_16235 [Pistacia integerrima]|uniref:Uncharacterized protein n=1 Tax=Pistacia integerrima TaxID=434235 RepID=A0ACC0ZAF4_9ROSI|nr:hypothetical protein Pint_16235 [Pistacia integerrima]
MFTMNIPKKLWGDAILTTCYLINSTPLKFLKKNFPHLRNMTMMDLKTFGCTVFVHIPTHLRSKLDPRAERCVFLGYAPNKRGYKCLNPKTGKIYFSMDVVFLEKPFFIPNSTPEETPGSVSDPLPTILDEYPDLYLPIALRKGVR